MVLVIMLLVTVTLSLTLKKLPISEEVIQRQGRGIQ